MHLWPLINSLFAAEGFPAGFGGVGSRRALRALYNYNIYKYILGVGMLFAKVGVGIKPARRLDARGGLEYCLPK